jgi:hypothetical protein
MGTVPGAMMLKHAMGEWKARQTERPMQGPPTEIQMLREEVRALRQRQADREYAQALSEYERTLSRA